MDLREYQRLNTSRREERPNPDAIINETDVDWSLKHFFVLLIAGGVMALVSSLLLIHFNGNPGFTAFWPLAFSLIGLFVVIIFQTLLLRSFQLFLWVSLLEATALFLPLFSRSSGWLVFGVLLFVASLLSGFKLARIHLSDNLRIHFFHFARRVVHAGTVGVALFLAFTYVGLFQHSGLSATAFSVVSKSSGVVLVEFVPNFSPEMSANNFFTEFARGQLASNEQLQQFSEAEKEQVYEASGRQLRNQIVEVTKTTVRNEDTFNDYFYRVANHYLTDFSQNSQATAVMVLLILLAFTYFIARGILFFLSFGAIGIGRLVYAALLSMGVIAITTEPRTKEIIVIK